MGRISVVHLGRLIGATIIVGGIGIAFWNVSEVDFADFSNKVQFFFGQIISWVALGSLVYLASEILDQVVKRNSDIGPLIDEQDVD